MKRLYPLLVALLLCQCADQADGNKVADESMQSRFTGREKQGYYQDSEGNWKIQNNKRSSFEGMGQSSMANREFSGKAYSPANVTKKSWWGDTSHSRPAYTGNTSASHFATPAAGVDKSAQESGRFSLFSRKSVSTPRIASQTARENANTAREGGTSSYQNKRSGLESSPIIDWQAQRAMDVQDTKNLLKK